MRTQIHTLVKILSLEKVYGEGEHNAFTGLAHYLDHFHLAFRSGVRHGSEGGCQIRMVSKDGAAWTVGARTTFPSPPELPPGTPMDLRDNYFLNLGTELRIYSFVLAPLGPHDDYLRPPATTVQASKDGHHWTAPREVYLGAILWKPIFWDGIFWCAGYRRIPGKGLWVELYTSTDGFSWERRGPIAVGNETALDPQPSGALRAYIRTHDAPHHLEIWEATPPFEVWRKTGAVPGVIQAPHLVHAGRRTFLLGRSAPPQDGTQRPFLCRAKVWEVDGTTLHEVLELPSLGDTSYFGAVAQPDGTILASYYSQHERETSAAEETRGGNDKPSDIFLARLQP
jgi:hypothetical protein